MTRGTIASTLLTRQATGMIEVVEAIIPPRTTTDRDICIQNRLMIFGSWRKKLDLSTSLEVLVHLIPVSFGRKNQKGAKER